MDIIEDHYDQASTIIASQIPVAAWYQLIGEITILDAIFARFWYAIKTEISKS